MKNWCLRIVVGGLVLGGLLALVVGVGQAEEEVFDLGEIVVTATRRPQPIGGISASVTVIDAEEIAEGGEITVLEALRGLPGLDVVQTGAAGGTTSIFLRGAEPRHTLVLIDGVEVNSLTTGVFDFANLTVDNIERIEIVRGPQSTLYGSDAMGGVINIITKRGVWPPRWELSAEAGALTSRRVSLATSGSVEPLDYSLSISRFDTDGISRVPAGIEDDGHENTSFSARFGFPVLEEAELDFVLRYTEASVDLDGWGVDDLDRVQDTTETVFSARFNQLLTENWSHQATFSLSDGLLEIMNPDITSEIDTRISAINWQHEIAAGEASTFIAGMEWEEQEALSRGIPWGGTAMEVRFDDTITNWGYYLQHQWDWEEEFFLTTGLRVDDHETFGSDTNYQIGIAYLFPEIPVRLRGNWGTAFRAPTFNQLFWPDAGNPDLLPEESVGYDLGIDFWGEQFHLGVTYFHNEFENLIIWPPENVDEARTKGVELEVSLMPADNFKVSFNYTHTDTEVLAGRHKGNELARRPRVKYGLSFNYRPVEKLNLNLHLNHMGDRWDRANNKDKTPSYTRVDLAASYGWTEDFQLFLRGENIFNEDYEGVKGFGTPGASVFTGVRATF